MSRRSREGWQLDVFSEWQCTSGITGSGFTWEWHACEDTENGFEGTFYDQLIDIDGIWRIAKGDNRRLQFGTTRYDGRYSLWNKVRRFLGLI